MLGGTPKRLYRCQSQLQGHQPDDRDEGARGEPLAHVRRGKTCTDSDLVLTNGSYHQSLQLFCQIFRCVPDDVLVLLRVEVHIFLVVRLHAPNDG